MIFTDKVAGDLLCEKVYNNHIQQEEIKKWQVNYTA